MKLIAGLGNPDDKYKFTRHNAGFMVLDYLANRWGFDFKFESKFNAQIAKTNRCGESIVLVKPFTYMNLSGNAIQPVMNFYKIPPEDIIIVYDDLDLHLGQMRFRAKGSAGGHNGIKSIINSLGGNQKFDRLKIGIGPQPPIPSEAFVLQNFTQEQLDEVKTMLKKADEALECYLERGLYAAQNKFN